MQRKSSLNTQVCPWWLCPTFDNPLRKWAHNPQQILKDLVEEGQVIMDLGCGMGYFAIPLAWMVGPQGHVIAVDLQPRMLRRLRQRAERAGVADRLQIHQNTPASIGLSERVDFALAFWMVHEVAQPQVFLGEVRQLLKGSGALLLVEPILHVNASAFQRTVDLARQVGLRPRSPWKVNLSRAVVLEPCEAEKVVHDAASRL